MRRVSVLALALLLPACSREIVDAETVAIAPDQNGSLRVELTTVGEDGASYVLRNSTVEIGGAVLLTLTDASGHDEALSTPLPSGSYSAFLRPGFQVAKLEADGTERVIDAQLLGDNPQRFALTRLQDSKLKLSFALGDQQLVFGAAPALRVTSALAY